MKTKDCKIDRDKYDNLLAMLTSSDGDNSNMALMIIEQMDFTSGKVYFALMYKLTKDHLEDKWKEHATTLYKNIHNMGIDESFSWKSMWNVLKKDMDKEEKASFLEVLTPIVEKILNNWGFDAFPKDLQITIKQRKDDN